MDVSKRIVALFLPVLTSTCLGLFWSCTDPDLEVGLGLGRACGVQNDCAPGLNCDSRLKQCAPSYQNRNGVYSDYVVLGLSAPISGERQALGQDAAAGIKAYFDHINTTSEGIYGRQLRLALYDNKGEDALALQNAQTMTNPQQRPIFASLGNLGTANLPDALSPYQDQGVVALGPHTGAESIRVTPPPRYIYPLGLGDARSSARLVDHLLTKESVPPKNLGILAPAPTLDVDQPWANLTPQTQDSFQGASDAIGTQALPISQWFPSSFPADQGTPLDASLDRTLLWMLAPERTQDPAGGARITLLLLGDAFQNARFITALNRRLESPPASLTPAQVTALGTLRLDYAVHSTGALGLARQLAPEDCQGILAALPLPPIDPSTTAAKDYLEHLSKSTDSPPPSLVGFGAYLAAQVLVQALKRAGPDLSDDALVEALQAFEAVPLGPEMSVTLSATDHQILRALWIAKLSDSCTFIESEQIASP